MPADSHVGPYVSSIDPVVPPALNEAVPENFVHVTFSLTPLPDPSVVRAGEPTPSMVFAPLGVGLMCSVSNADANEGSARTDAPSAASRITVILFCMVLRAALSCDIGYPISPQTSRHFITLETLN